MKAQGILTITVCLLLCLTGCAGLGQTETTSSGDSSPGGNAGLLDRADSQQEPDGFAPADQMAEPFTTSTSIQDVIDNSVFAGYGRLLFPVEDWYMSGSTLGDLQLTWYNNIDPEETVEIVNTLWQRANAGETVFYDIYTEEEKAEDPAKEDTGLFFFRGDPGAKFAMCNADGGFAYVGAMLCRTVFPMRWNYPSGGIMLSLSSTAPEPKQPVKIWRGPSALFLSTRKNWRLTPTVTLSGAVQPEAVSMRPDLYAAYLHGASQWDGDYAPIAKNGVAVYIFMAENDEYYGSERAWDAYNSLHDAYSEAGWSEEQIADVLQIQTPDDEWFAQRGITGNYHGGGNVVFGEDKILNWILSHTKEENIS